MDYWTPARAQLAQSCRFSKPLLPYCTALLSSENPEDPSCNCSLNNYCSPGCVREKHSLPQGSSVKTRGLGGKDLWARKSQKEATKPGRAFSSSICLETALPFPGGALLEIVLDSEGSAGGLLEKQWTKTGFQTAETVLKSSTYRKFGNSPAV